jgi:hypothetical protein
MNLKSLGVVAFSFFALMACNSQGNDAATDENGKDTMAVESEPIGENNVAYIWGNAALQGTAYDTDRFKPRPTVTSRYLGLIMTSMFDAWSRFDDKAIPVTNADIARRPAEERTLENKEIAISYAALRTMNEYYYSDSAKWNKLMVDLGYDPNNRSLDPNTPEGIGNLMAKTIIENRREDGANQYATHEGSDGIQYFDYTNYKPVNSVEEMVDLKRWQPKYFLDSKGNKYEPGCLTPHWDKVKPIALDSASQFRPGPPPAMDSEQLKEELAEVVSIQENMTDYDKALVEFMRDGPQSVQQAGHWLRFSQYISKRDKHTLDDDVKMYFLVQVTAMDGFIACWDSKMYYDYARPYALVHKYYSGTPIKCWAGEGKGFKVLDGGEWQPYSPAEFLCPPFPSYVSGHSTISGGCAEALKLFTGGEEFGDEATVVAGVLTEKDPNNYGDTIVLKFPTFTEAAEMAGQSRVMGGYHIQADNIAGLELGRDVAHKAWEFYNKHLGN